MATSGSWDSVGALAAAYRVASEAVTPFLVGVEEELILLDAESLMPMNAIERVIAAVDGDPRFATELRTCQIEIVTPPCETAAQVAIELAHARSDLVERIDSSIRPTAVAAHPLSVEPAEVTDRDRYHAIAERCGSAALDGVASGLHVHVGVGGSEPTLAVFNALRSYLPEIAALAASSPYAGGRDTGFASIRAKLNERLPQSGIPPRIPSWEALAEFVFWGRRGGLFPDPSHLWWDMRPHPLHGTIEIRIADVQTSVEHAAGVAALCQALVAELARRHSSGERLPTHDDARIRTNVWQAQRYGLDAMFADLDTGEPQAVLTRIARLLGRLGPVAATLGDEGGLDLAWALLADGGAVRHRRLADRHGLPGLVRILADETTRSAKRLALSRPAA